MTVTIDKIDTTQTGEPVYEIGGSDGTIEAIPSGSELYIPIVMCDGDTKMGDLVTKAVNELDRTTVKFPNVLNPQLIKKLDGFEKTTEIHEGIGEPVDVWVGEWDTGRHT